jgi:hypothetical protein
MKKKFCTCLRVTPYLKNAIIEFARQHQREIEEEGNEEDSIQKLFAVGFFNMPMHHK